MAPSSANSSFNSRRTNSHATNDVRPRMSTRFKRIPVPEHDAYLFALRVAYLSYLLQPRQKRVQHVANTSKPIQRSSTSIQDMVKDFSLIRDNKSTRFPHGFMGALDKRITGVLLGQEKGPEYKDALVKRSFATFLNEFKNPTFRKSMEKDRRVEDLLLIFFSKATSELQKGKSPDDDSWKLMVDRHVALFVRLISGTLHSNDWTRERPELSSRLKTLETKLLQHDQDLAASSQRSEGGGQTIEVEVPRSYEIKDMPLVIRVARVFSKPTIQVQNDINAHRDQWTEKAALKDLKDYQHHLMLGTGATLTKDDFDLDEAFESWRKGESIDLSQMMLTIMQSNPELAKTSSSGATLSNIRPQTGQGDGGYNDSIRLVGDDGGQTYVIDQPVDMNSLNLDDHSRSGSMDGSQASFTFIPIDVRSYYRQVLKSTLTHDLADQELQAEEVASARILSKQSTEMLHEIALWWRVPLSTRMILLLDVIREKYQDQEIHVETVDASFTYVKEPQPEVRKTPGRPNVLASRFSLYDRSNWPLADYALNQSMLSMLHDAILRELFELFSKCYEAKPPSIGAVMYVLENHVYSDPLFQQNPADMEAFAAMLSDALRREARSKYHDMLSKHVPDNAEHWEFYSVVMLGKAVTAMCEKIQKRYKKNREVMGVNPLTLLVEEVLPGFAEDARELVMRIMELSKGKEEEVPIQDGFDLYKELVDIRRVYAQALPGRAFEFHIEDLLQEFVWRWIRTTDAKLLEWVESAVKLDDFQIRQDSAAQAAGEPPTDEEKHSQSAIEVFRIFNQSIDQIVKLEWDDDLQYAKFMTAASKSFGRGIARYCELLESKFGKEMDRQTPEQEMRAQQTQREKWMSVAKDVWANGGQAGTKIEPFQFWPESFVKINNVEYATNNLDKIEHEMNVDGLVEVINRYEPPPPPNPRGRPHGSKFMFTIKIIEAEDLKAGDMNGFSDPYVVLGDEYQKRLAKTRTVYQSLNPRWDETVDILTTGPLNVIATVWDWDLMGDHDCLGRTSLKLDPSHFNDYLPREYWLDLDTQGRVLVRVSMEGERDDIQFYFAKAFRTLKRTQRDMTRKITDKLNSYIQQCLSRRTLKALLSQGTIAGVSMSTAKGYFSKLSSQVAGRPVSVGSALNTATPGATQADAAKALAPLLQYFDDNFAIMKQTLTDSAMKMVMSRLWKEVLVTIEGLLVPPLSEKISAQRPLTQQEVDIVYKWLQILFDFFHAYNDETKEADGVPLEVLKSPKYHDLQNLNFFYFEPTDNLIRTSDAMAQANASRQAETAARLNRLSAPASSFHARGMMSMASGSRRTKSIMMSRNLGTMRQAKEEKRKEAQADPNDDMILRILRMRPEAEKYLKDRSRQKERLAAAAAAEAIVRQSLQASRLQAMSQHSQPTSGGKSGLTRRWDTIRE
ncbi:Hypothetical protein R9X50_00791900 [Acrodontium crateriforme]|uniref:C2 domain containing protein n=1 Tax=Acrodontium crateriforme TaxID=150365 RepID=A0AAQ3MDC4_9PEZI|nr:Hypothetical protein R9X50_00791900 [Acrodontium crateriforme]